MSSKRFKVVGTQPVLDHLPGETFDASLAEDQESFLVSIGALRVVRETKTEAPKKSADRR